MSNKYIMAGVGNARAFDKAGNFIFNARALTDSGFNISTSKEEIRGGQGAALQGQYFHTTQFGVTLKDAIADLNYFSLQVGGMITQGGDVFKTEQVTVESQGQITVQGTPKDFGGYGIIGWYSHVGKDDYTKITFSGKTANDSGAKQGEIICVTYVESSDSARAFEVATAFVPSEVHLVFDMPLFNAGAMTDEGAGTESQIGVLQVDIPRFQFNGSVDMSTAMASAASVDISGMALQSGSTGCSGKGIYATITEYIYNKGAFDNVSSLAVIDGNVELDGSGSQETLQVMAIYNDGTSPSIISNSKLTFTSETSGTATVGANDGIVRAVSNGDSVIEIKVTEKPELVTKAVVTVTGI